MVVVDAPSSRRNVGAADGAAALLPFEHGVILGDAQVVFAWQSSLPRYDRHSCDADVAVFAILEVSLVGAVGAARVECPQRFAARPSVPEILTPFYTGSVVGGDTRSARNGCAFFEVPLIGGIRATRPKRSHRCESIG